MSVEGILQPERFWTGTEWTGPITDGHLHLDRSGRFLDAMRDFYNSGGTRIILVHKPNFECLPTNVGSIREAYIDTLAMADEVRDVIGLKVQVVLGPHPVTWVHQIPSMGLEEATTLHLDAVDIALDYFESGDCVAVGEVGRPHFPVEDEIWSAANEMLHEVLHRCSKRSCPVQLHVENRDDITFSEIDKIRSRAGLPVNLTLRHYAPSNVTESFRSGLPVTVSMGKESIQGIVLSMVEDGLSGQDMTPFMMETDYLDDPRRPGAVLGPKTLPKRTNELGRHLQMPTSKGGLGWNRAQVANLLWMLHRVWPDTLYGECR